MSDCVYMIWNYGRNPDRENYDVYYCKKEFLAAMVTALLADTGEPVWVRRTPDTQPHLDLKWVDVRDMDASADVWGVSIMWLRELLDEGKEQ